MAKLEVLSQDRKKVETIELRDDVFNVKVNVPLIHQVLKAQQAAARQGTAKTKVKSEVRGGGKKPFKQKGTGNARQGSSRSPLNPGGGQTFGPRPRDYRQNTPKEMVRGAIRSIISDRFQSERLLVLDEVKLKEPKTRELAKILTTGLKVEKVLLVDEANEKLERSARNIPYLKILRSRNINVYDVISSEWLIMTKRAAQIVEEWLAPDRQQEGKR